MSMHLYIPRRWFATCHISTICVMSLAAKLIDDQTGSIEMNLSKQLEANKRG